MFPLMSGPGKMPSARTAERLYPSGDMLELTTLRSVTGPIAVITGSGRLVSSPSRRTGVAKEGKKKVIVLMLQ